MRSRRINERADGCEVWRDWSTFRWSTASRRWAPRRTPIRRLSSPDTANANWRNDRPNLTRSGAPSPRESGRSGSISKHVNLYQDSLPVCGHERALVHEIASQGSRNHQLLEALADSGALLVGTESPALLLDEYRLMQSPERTEAQAAAVLDARDQFIARRIDATLSDGTTGILFIGALHHVAKFLPKRIRSNTWRFARPD